MMTTEVTTQDHDITPWLEEGRELARRATGLEWDIGDWWHRGEHVYGKRARLAVECFHGGYSYGTLRNMGSLARSIEPSRRRDDVSFWKHWETLADFVTDEQQDKLLAEIAEKGLTVRQIRRRVTELQVPAVRKVQAAARAAGPAEQQEGHDAPPVLPTPCARCANLEAECVALSEAGARQHNELERIHASYKGQFEKLSAHNARLKAKVKDLEQKLRSANKLRSVPDGAVFDSSSSKLLSLAVDTDSDDEAMVAFLQARARHRKAGQAA